jgi:hypothetical protein
MNPIKAAQSQRSCTLGCSGRHIIYVSRDVVAIGGVWHAVKTTASGGN